MSASELRLTNADLEAMPEDGNRYEVIDGELYVSGAPGFINQIILVRIVSAFVDYLRGHPIGEIAPGVGVVFDDYDGVIPDLVFATHERVRKALAGGRFHAAPEIVIEILSPCPANDRRDRHVKLRRYATRGVGEYWIVDPENHSVEVHRRDVAGDPVFEQSLRRGDELTSGFLPGFAVRADTLLASLPSKRPPAAAVLPTRAGIPHQPRRETTELKPSGRQARSGVSVSRPDTFPPRA